MKKESSLSNRERKLVRSISARSFWEDGCETGWNPGYREPVPRWFVDIRNNQKLRFNCHTQATIYLRDDGHLFVISKQYWPSAPASSSGITDLDKFYENVHKAEGAKPRYGEIYEACEYIPDKSCENTRNLFKVAVNCRRTGRFFFTAKKKTAKAYLEVPDEQIHWIYSEQYDQFTESYERRHQKQADEFAKRVAKENESRKKNAKTFEFNFNDFSFDDFISDKPVVDHFAVLGVRKKAGPREIKRAYWSLARQYHPDLNPNDREAEEKFKCISVSYQELMKTFDV